MEYTNLGPAHDDVMTWKRLFSLLAIYVRNQPFTGCRRVKIIYRSCNVTVIVVDNHTKF